MEQLISLAGNFGAPGLLIAYMVWQERVRSVDQKELVATLTEMEKTLAALKERVK